VYSKKESGFTLIELLIVIVIIGILAGVLIAVINPAQQQNRARDAGVKASMNKIALATEGYISAYGSAPDEIQFFANLQNVSQNGTTCSSSGGYDCQIDVDGNTLPATCTNGWGGSGSSQCYYRYLSAAVSTTFEIYAKSYGIADTVFKYDNTIGTIQHCNQNGSSCVTP